MITNRLGKNYLLKISNGNKVIDPFDFSIVDVKPAFKFKSDLEMVLSDNLTFTDLANFLDFVFGLNKMKLESWFSIGKQKIVMFNKNVSFENYGDYSFIYEYEPLILIFKFIAEKNVDDFRYNVILKNGNIFSLNISASLFKGNIKEIYDHITTYFWIAGIEFNKDNINLENEYADILLTKFNKKKSDIPAKLPRIGKIENFDNFLETVNDHQIGDLIFPIEYRTDLDDNLWFKDVEDSEKYYYETPQNKQVKNQEHKNENEFENMFNDKNIFEDPMGSLEKMVGDLYNAAKSMGISDSEMEDYFKKTFEEFKSFTLPSFDTPNNMEKSLMDALHKIMNKNVKNKPETKINVKTEIKEESKSTLESETKTKNEKNESEIN
ncbi:hypothetical protein DA803_00620 [[Mycoplasma] phocae]|uniref:Uncharacterized protein n=1 Tax=[Mycoplasma] phocae TaxID=142651 RepID=A0A2Z5IPH9_9BACT|nr:hypothetical protein [[Mycoplasma] phocae]AXE60599.1 hypothetical protein DA803_00620 [[Mycoplasma] phocae]